MMVFPAKTHYLAAGLGDLYANTGVVFVVLLVFYNA